MPNMANISSRQFLKILGGSFGFCLILNAVLRSGVTSNNKELNGSLVIHSPDFESNWLESASPAQPLTEFSDIYTDEHRSSDQEEFLDKVKIIRDIIPDLFTHAKSSEQVIAKIIDIADGLKEAHASNAEYLKQLASNMQGMTLPGMQRFLNKEKSKLLDNGAGKQLFEKYRLFSAPKKEDTISKPKSAYIPVKGLG